MYMYLYSHLPIYLYIHTYICLSNYYVWEKIRKNPCVS